MHQPPPPESRELLPPLLACLPVAFASPRPPPALLPQLAPVLRQRLSYLTSTNNQRSDGWLPLLSWDGERGSKLPEVVERMELEPHPVSGELELDDVRPAKYRRLDEETLHARLEVEQFEILPIYLWCDADEHGGTGPGWKLAELRALEDMEDGLDWYHSISEANDAIPVRRASLAVPESLNGVGKASTAGSDDDAYWAAYDRSQGQTPAPKPETAPQPAQRTAYHRQRSQSELDYFARYGGSDNSVPSQQQAPTSILRTHGRQRSRTELDYFSRYGNEVQPALDAEDPDEKAELERNNIITNNNNNRDSVLQPDLPRAESRPSGASLYPADKPLERPSNASDNALQPFPSYNDIPAPRAISPASRSSHGSGSIERLEQRARAISEAQSQASDVAQTAIKQHISTDIKSLFRLARNTGIERRDFERIVKRELECLSMLERDDGDD